MGLREKVTITLVIIALTQIACRRCMPRTPRKASLKRYLNDLKPVKNNPVSTPYSPSKVNKTPKQTLGKTAQNGRISQNSLPKKSLYNTYNFPENEYPLDNAPRDPFRIGMNFNENNHVNTLQKARYLQNSAINDLKKEMKMKRKLLSNKQVNNENIPLKTDMSSIKIASNPDPVRLLDPESFPEVQYPLNTMETWGQNYWNYLPFTQEKQLNGFGRQAFNPKAREAINQPFTRLTKAEASKFLQSYDKLKEEQRRTSTENSKRSNVGQKGLNFTKTATCERVSDDFITAGLLSNTLENPSVTKTLDLSTTAIANSAENTCPLTENPYYQMPLPYKVIEKNIKNVCPAFELKNNTQELEDEDSSIIAKTLQLIEEILLNDDTSLKVPPKSKENTTEVDCAGGSANKDIPINPIDNAETFIVVPIEELSQEVSDDSQADIMPYNLPSLPEETMPENTTTLAGPLNVRMPFPFMPITYGALTNASSPDLTNTTTSSNVNTVPGYTSIIIIPMNNDAVGKSQSHMFETTSDTPIIVYLPSTQSSGIPSQTPPLNHIVSSSLGNLVPNNQLCNDLSNMAPVQNNNPSSTSLVSGSSLPMHETLPTNSMYYNNENTPSSMREKPVSEILIHKSLTDVAPFVTPSCDEKLSQQPDNFDVNPNTLPQTPYFKHPVFDFADNDVTSLSHGPYNNVLLLNNELPIIAREIDSDHQITDTSSKDLFIATQNTTTEHLHKTNSMDSVSDDSLSETPNGVSTVALDKKILSETPSDSLEILKNLHVSDYLSNLLVSTDKSISPSTISKQISESLQPIEEMPSTLLVGTPTVEPPPTEASLTPNPLSETFMNKLPEIMDTKVPPTIVSDITSDTAPKPIDNTLVPSPILHSTPMTTDMALKTELYKIRQILDRMLSSETPTVIQPPSMGTTLSSISETDSLPLLVNQLLPPIQTPTESQPPPLTKPLSAISDTDSLPLLEEKSLSPIQTSIDSQPPPLDNVVSPISDTDSLPLLENQSLSPTQTPTDSVPLLAGDKTLLPLPLTDSPIDSLQLQDHETLQKTPIDDGSKDTLSSPMDKSHLSNLKSTESPPQRLDETVPPIPLFETTIDNKPYLIDNLVTPLCESVTSRTRDFTNNGLPQKMNDLPLKMDLELPDIYEVYNDDLPLSVDDLPIKVHQGNSESPLSMVVLPMDVVETPDLLSKTPAGDLVTPTDVLSLPVEEVLENASPGFSSESDTSLLSDSMDNEHPDFPLSKHPSDGLPALPMDKFKPIHEVIPNSQFHEMSSEIQLQKYDLPLSVDKLIPNMSLSDALSNEPFVIDDSPSPVTDKIPEIPNSTADAKNSPLVDNLLLSPEDDASPDTSVTDIPTAMLPPLKEALQSAYLDKTNDEVLSESTLSDLDLDDYPLPDEKTIPLPDNTLTNLLPSNKTLSTSKLPITKALLENVLSDITKGVLSSQVAKALPVTPVSDKTVYYADEKYPLSETKETPLLPVEYSFPNAGHHDNLIDIHVSEITENTPTTGLPFEFPLPMDKMYNGRPEISTDEIDFAKGENENETQTSDNLSDDQPLPKGKISPLTDILSDISRKEKLSSSKLPITKALLENVLSEINTKGFSIPVSKAVSATSSSVLDKTHYYIDSPLSDFAEDRLLLPEDKILTNTAHNDNNVPFSGQSDDTLSLKENKTLSEIQSIDISTEMTSPMNRIVPNDDLPSPVTKILPFPKDTPRDSQLSNNKNKTPSSSKLPIAKTLLENVLSDINTKGFSLTVAKALPVASRSQLDKTLYFLESPRPDTTEESLVSDVPTENDHYSQINEDVLPLSADKVAPEDLILDIHTDELPTDEISNDNLDGLTEEVEDSDETLSLEEPTDDTNDFPTEIDEQLSLTDDIPDDFPVPPTKQIFSSRLPITKALLEKVLSDITDGAIAAKDLLNHPNL